MGAGIPYARVREAASMGKIIGIDLGTTNSVAAYMDHTDPRIIINEEGGRVTPSVIAFAQNGDRLVGDIAKRQMLINPDATAHSIKRFMGRRYDSCRNDVSNMSFSIEEAEDGDCLIPLGGRMMSPQEVSAMILQKLRRSAENFLGEEVTEAVVTVPAYFTDRQRQATRDAGTLAGIDVVRIINEPTAAALAYVHNRKKSSTIAVYDWGGGTFDISILHVERDIAEVQATRGDNQLGGKDIDQAVVGWLMTAFQEAHGTQLEANGIVLQRLQDAAERAKIELSSTSSTEVHLPFLLNDADGPKHLQASLSREIFEGLAEPFIQTTIKETRQALNDAGMKVDAIDEVIMVGGSSRIPRVQALVGEVFERALNKSFNPDEVVAIGAAIQGGILEGEVKAVTLLDVTNFSLGIAVEGNRFATLIPKNTTIPTQKTQMVSTVVDNQRTVRIHVLQGEHVSALANTSLGEFELHNVQPAPRGVPRIEVIFGIDVNGIVNVAARDIRTGVEEQIVIRAPGSSHRSSSDADEETGFDEPVREIREKLEGQLADLEAFLREHRGRIHKSDASTADQELQRGRMALLRSQKREQIEDLSNHLSRYTGELTTKVDNPPE
jgi:molecular chaperone DnaK